MGELRLRVRHVEALRQTEGAEARRDADAASARATRSGLETSGEVSTLARELEASREALEEERDRRAAAETSSAGAERALQSMLSMNQVWSLCGARERNRGGTIMTERLLSEIS